MEDIPEWATEEYQSKISDRPARPWDLLNVNINRVSENVSTYRYEICKSCEFITSLSRQCKKCGCFMKIKTLLPDAFCPINKWGKVNT
jgi:hypothetical protein